MFGRKTLEFMLICIGDEMRDSLEYSKVNIPLPPKAEQDRIVTQIERLMCSLDSIAETLV